MQDSKLLKLFKLLDKEELRRFKKQLQSPFFTTNSHLLKIYEYLIKSHPSFTSPKLKKELIFTYIFSKKTYNDNKLRMLFRAFTRQLEDFLIIKEVRANEAVRKKRLISIYGQRNEMELFEKGTFKLFEEIETLPIKNRNHFFEMQQLLQELIYHPTKPKLKEVAPLQTEMMEYLDLHYWVNKIWLSCNLLSTQKFLNLDYAVKDLEIVIEKLPIKYFQKYPTLKVFVKAFHFLNKPSDSAYYDLKKTYLINIDKIDQSNKRDLFNYLLNYTISQYNQGVLIFSKENFEWIKTGLKHELLIESGRMDDSGFTNCCLSAIRVNAFNWAEQFIKDNKKYLDEHNKEDVITLCMAYLLFYRSAYSPLIDLLLTYRFQQFKDNLRGKALLIRSYFELFLQNTSYLETFISNSYAFEKFLRRDEVAAKNVVNLYLNFISVLRKMAKLIYTKKWNNDSQIKFKKKVTEEKIALKQWLLDEIEKLQTLNYD